MRRIVSALALVLLVGAAGGAATPQTVHAAAHVTKAVIVVGATQGVTPSYRRDADEIAAVFPSGTEVIKVYSPNATWDAVAAAAIGANILIYLGHGSGYPNPYLSYEQPAGDNGMGLNAAAGHGDSNTKYYGSNYMAQLGLAPNAIVLLNHLCYASGDSEPGRGKPTLDVAKHRIEGYASGFIRGGAKAVIAEGMNDLSYYINSLFNTNQTIDAVFNGNPWLHNNVSTWPSTHSAGYTAYMDPDIQHPQSDGDIYYRSMVALPSTTTSTIISGTIPPFVSKSGTYHPIAPVRVVDTRSSDPGPLGKLASIGAYNFQIAGKSVGGNVAVPSNAIAVTATLTVTNAIYSGGWVFLGPTIWGTPQSSTINFPAKDNRANGVTVPLSDTGSLSAWYRGSGSRASVDLIIDVTGYYTADTSGYYFQQFGPKRILDTRDGTGLSGKFQTGVPRTINVAGVQGLPATGIKAVVGNLTVIDPSQRGFAYLGPTPDADPTSSTLNFPSHDIRANNFVVQVNADGTIALTYETPVAGAADFVIDISGYFTTGSGTQFHTLNPARVLDSRVPTGLAGVVPGSTPQTLAVIGHGGVPTGAVAVVANLTVTGQQAKGFLAAGPTISPETPFSNLNFPTGDNRANGVTVPIAGNGSIQLVYGASSSVTTHAILDVCGYFK